MQENPEMIEALKEKRKAAGDENPDRNDFFKVIYGCEAYLVDDLKEIVTGDKGQVLRDSYVVFDIETTGFSGDYASVYLIGCVWHDGNTWILTQYFAETRDAEEEVLDAFFALLRTKRILVHFNGDGFDIPFLTKRCVFYKKDWNFEAVESFDIYKKIRPVSDESGHEYWNLGE